MLDLKSQEAREAVKKIRASNLLSQLRDQLGVMFARQRVLVVGSAPDAIAPDLRSIDKTICVNASAWNAREMGLGLPDMTVVAGFSTLLDKPVRAATQKVWRRLATRDLVFIEAGATAFEGRRVLDQCGFEYRTFTSITQVERAAIIGEVCGQELALGRRDDRISNGMFAAALAMWAGAQEVVLAGFSMSGGHAYMGEGTPREHQAGDDAFLRLASSLPARLRATGRELSQAYGL